MGEGTGSISIERHNQLVAESLYKSQRNIIKKMIKSIPKTELTNILLEMKIIKKDWINKGYIPSTKLSNPNTS